MPSYGGVQTVRDDYRCLMCRQKDVFHCEHDTPYRDRFLLAKEQERRESNRNNAATTGQVTNRGPANNPNGGTTNNTAGGRGLNGQNLQRTPGNKTSTTGPKTDDQKKKKSCVIL